MDIYSDCLKNDWPQLKSLPVLTVEQIKECDDDCIRMYLYCFYNYPEFYNYKKKKLLDRCININGDNLLLLSAFIGHIHILEYLESRGFKINTKSKDVYNVYCVAAKYNQLDTIKYLSKKYINKNSINLSHAYLTASYYGHLDIVKYLQTTDIDSNIKNRYGNNVSLTAITSGHIHLVQYFLQNGYDMYVENLYGHDAYMAAAIYGHLDIMKYLETLNNNININYYNRHIIWNYAKTDITDHLENKFIYSGFLKICSICYDVKNDKFITCKNNHIVHLTCQQFKNRNKCLNCSFKYVI